VLEVPGGTLVDTILTSPAFAAQVGPLLAPLGCTWPPATPAQAQGCLQVVHVMKWILDPADPLNFARHVTSGTLPNLLAAGGIPGNADGTQLAKDVLAQIAVCDQTVPNGPSALLAANLGLAPFRAPAAPGGTGTVQWYSATTGPAIADVYPGSGCAAGRRMDHAFLLDWGDDFFDDPGTAFPDDPDYLALREATVLAQTAAADFLVAPQPKPTLVVVPAP
jgi:hypothetical protein